MNIKNIFDTKKTDDLPDVIKQSLRKPKEGKSDYRIACILELAKRPLSIDEILVAYYRLHNEVKTRRQMIAIMYRLSKDPRNKIVRIKGRSGVFKLEDKKGLM